MSKQKFRVSIIDFLPEHGKHEVGQDGNGEKIHLGDMVLRHDKEKWFVAYRYGRIMLKQVGMMAMLGSDKFDAGDFSGLEKLKNTIGAGPDWLIVGYTDEPLYNKIKDISGIELINHQ